MTEIYARCENENCRGHNRVLLVSYAVIVDGRLRNKCFHCGETLIQLSSRELREIREARNQLRDRRRE